MEPMRMAGYWYILTEEGTVESAKGMLATEYEEWFLDMDNRRIAVVEMNGIRVSTVFLGLDHCFMMSSVPILFETMIFGGEHDGYCERYTSLEDAMRGHEEAIRMVWPELERSEDP